MKRLLLLTTALIPLAQAGAAFAETTISTAVTAPVATSTAASGSPDDLTIDAAGSVKPAVAGAAVILDSNNKVTNAGDISFNGLNDSVAILVLGGRTGSVSNTGTISLVEDYTATDADSDGDIDGVLAQGARRYGIRVTGPDGFTGSIGNTGAISIEGVDSKGVSVETALAGNLDQSGIVGMIGDRSVGVQAGPVSGNVRLAGTITAQGAGAVGADLAGDVGGGVVIQGSIIATGFRDTSRLADTVRAKYDADDLLLGGSAVRIAGSVAHGVVLDTAPADNDTANTDEDADGITDSSEGVASVNSYGSAPALDIGGAGATTLGLAGTGESAYGLLIKGSVAAAGVNDGVSATAVRIGQPGGGTTTLEGGISLFGGSVGAEAFGANATALLLNPGASATTLRNGGSLAVKVTSTTATAARAVVIEAGATSSVLWNSGAIAATHAGGKGEASAVIDRSGTMVSVTNIGTITSAVTSTSGEAVTGKATALDLSANSTGALIRQQNPSDTVSAVIVGDVLLGSGADRVELLGGSLTGALAFGGGADSLLIDGGASVTGALTDLDGKLSLEVRNGRLDISNPGLIGATSLQVGAKGVLALAIDPATAGATRLQVAGAAAFADGAKVEITLKSLLRGSQSYEILKAGQLTYGAAQSSLIGSPFLYQATLRPDTTAGTLSVDLNAMTAQDIGLGRSGAAAFSAVFDSLDRDDTIEAAFLGKTDKAGFLALYDQMLPDHSGGSLSSAAAISSAISGAVGRRSGLDASDGSVAAWAQEIVFDLQRDAVDAAGFKSRGFGLAGGFEATSGPDAVGVTASFVTTNYNDRGAALSERVVMNFLEGGIYARAGFGALRIDARAGLGYVAFDGARRLVSTDDDLAVTAEADWKGWLADAHAGASYELSAGWFYVRPELSVDYLYLSEGGYQESGGGAGFDLSVGDRSGSLLTGNAMLALGGKFGSDSSWGPELTVGWRQRLAGDPGVTTARFKAGGATFTLSPEDMASGAAVVRLGIGGDSPWMSLHVDAGGEFNSDYRQYDVRAVVRFRF